MLGPERAIARRVLDAQFFGVAQRRRRVFVVATARGDIDPAKILFESEGMRRNSPPSRKTRQIVAPDAGYRLTNGSHWDGEHNPHPTLNQSFNTGGSERVIRNYSVSAAVGLLGHSVCELSAIT